MDFHPSKPEEHAPDSRRPTEEGYRPLVGGPEETGKGRHCTDLFCFLVFTIFVVVYCGVAVIGYQNGNPDLILYPFDSSGNQCGLPDSAYENYKYLYYVTLISGDTSYTVCVDHCPKNNTDVVCKPNTWVTDCSFTYRAPDNSTNAADAYSSYGFMGRYCMPTADVLANSTAAGLVDSRIKDNFSTAGSDIMTCWTAVLYVMLISIAVSIVYLVLIRYCVGLVLWVSIVLIFLGLIAFGLYLQFRSELYNDPAEADAKESHKWWAIGCYVVAGLFAIIICFMFERIQLAIAIMKAAASFIGDEFTVVLVPVISFVASICIIAFWVLALVFLYSSGELKKADKYHTFAPVEWDTTTRNLFYFEFASILWVNAFKVAMTQFTIACTVFYWYFEQNTSNNTNFKFLHAFWAGLRYHVGSLALGSFVLALVQLVQAILSYMQKHALGEKLANNQVTKYLCCCISCLIECFKRFIEYLNKNAYINMAYTSENFCTSAKRVFFLLLDNAARFIALGSIGTVFTFLGKGVITLVSSYLGYLIITKFEQYSGYIASPMPVLLVFIVVTYVVAGLFMSVYEMACDSIIIYFLYDESMNDRKAIHAPESLREFMQSHRDSTPVAVKAVD